MAASEELLTELISDAQRVAAYGQRTGRFRDIGLISAIAEAEKLTRPTWGDTEIVGLQAALNRATADILPVTIADLRDKHWKPFAPKRWWEYWPQLLFLLFALALLTLTSCATLDFNRGTTLAGEVIELADRTPQSDVNDAIHQLTAEGKTSEAYAQAVERLREIGASYNSYRNRINVFALELSRQPYYALALWLTGHRPPEESKLQELQYCPPNIDLRIAALAPDVQSEQNVRAREVAALCNEQLSAELLDGSTFRSIAYTIGYWVEHWGTIFLPALYGALGATIYYLRRFLDPAMRDPPAIRLAARIATGAFAGVVVTWFWTPDNQMLGSFRNAGFTIFTVAFLVGFGVEVLFVLLDRLVHGAMAVAKGTEARPSMIIPFYVGAAPPPNTERNGNGHAGASSSETKGEAREGAAGADNQREATAATQPS